MNVIQETGRPPDVDIYFLLIAIPVISYDNTGSIVPCIHV